MHDSAFFALLQRAEQRARWQLAARERGGYIGAAEIREAIEPEWRRIDQYLRRRTITMVLARPLRALAIIVAMRWLRTRIRKRFERIWSR